MSFDALKKSKRLSAKLLKKYSPQGPERGGFILPGGQLVEFKNVSDEPELGFAPDLIDAIPHANDAVGTWHTHPGGTANLSAEDVNTYVQWPELIHVIAGSDGLRWYSVKNGAVINA